MSHATTNRLFHLIDPRDDYWYLPLHECSRCDKDRAEHGTSRELGRGLSRAASVRDGCRYPKIHHPPPLSRGAAIIEGFLKWLRRA